MGIPLHHFPAAVRARMGLAIPTKPPRKARGTGKWSVDKATLTNAVVSVPRGTREVLLPIRTVTESNTGGSWRRKSARAKRQREITGLYVRRMDLPQMPVTVRMVRIGKRLMDVGDNLPSSLKHVRDEIAAVYGVDDGDERWDWRYEQEIGDEYGVRVKLEPRCGKG